jgi:hypothetical protein
MRSMRHVVKLFFVVMSMVNATAGAVAAGAQPRSSAEIVTSTAARSNESVDELRAIRRELAKTSDSGRLRSTTVPAQRLLHQNSVARTPQQLSWQELHDLAMAKRRKGHGMFWSGVTMLTTGIALSFVPAVSKYCYGTEYPASECAKRVGPLLAMDVAGAFLLTKGRKIRSEADSELRYLESSKPGSGQITIEQVRD